MDQVIDQVIENFTMKVNRAQLMNAIMERAEELRRPVVALSHEVLSNPFAMSDYHGAMVVFGRPVV